MTLEDMETASKKKIGRPCSVPARSMDINRTLYPDVRTSRGIQNKVYVACAVDALRPGGSSPADRHAWFVGDSVGNWRQGILVELGRVAVDHGGDVAIKLADQVAELFPNGTGYTTKEISSFVRRRRLKVRGRSSNASSTALAKRLFTEVVNYITEHPDTTEQIISDAMSETWANAALLIKQAVSKKGALNE